MKNLFLILVLLSFTTASLAAADDIFYKDAVVITTLKKRLVQEAQYVEISPAVYDKNENLITPAVTKKVAPAVRELYLDLPFKTYSEMVYCEGKDITSTYKNDLTLEDKEVMANVHVAVKNVGSEKRVKNEWRKCKNYAGYLPHPKQDPRYKIHYPVKKAQALATVNVVGEVEQVIPYAGPDKDDPADFCVSGALAAFPKEPVDEE